VFETGGLPTVTYCTEAFRALVQVRRQSLGLPGLPVVLLPHPTMTKSAAEIERLAEATLQQAIQALTLGAPEAA
jgi:hypothetical protein